MVLPANAEYIIIDSFSQSMLVDLDMILSGLSTHSKLMNMLWAENVENRINDVYRKLFEAIQLLNVRLLCVNVDIVAYLFKSLDHMWILIRSNGSVRKLKRWILSIFAVP
jgi:hypothetical protein